jgi:predicted Ser/Thr protein kinase
MYFGIILGVSEKNLILDWDRSSLKKESKRQTKLIMH